MILRFIMMGLGTGALAIIAHAIGSNDQKHAARLTTHALILSLLFSVLITVVGQLAVTPLFSALGAEGAVLTMVSQYMRIWFAGAVVMAVPSMMTQVLMGTGDTKSASMAMVVGTLVNLILDPIMIFGWGAIPAMGISGAALATIVAQTFGLLFPLYILTKKHHLIRWKLPELPRLLDSWHRILRLGIPSILSNLLTPLSMALVTRLIATYGAEAVAATGATSRLEMFAFMIPMSIGMSLVPFVAQNYGAGSFDRILEAQRETRWFALSYGLLTTVMFFIFAPQMASLFSDDPKVIGIMVTYLRTVCFGYGMAEAFRYSTFCLTGIQKPVSSAMLNLLRTLLLLVPLAFAGSHFFGLRGIFAGRLVTDIIASSIAMFYSWRVLYAMQSQQTSAPAPLRPSAVATPQIKSN